MRWIPIVLLLGIATPTAASAQTLYGWSGGWEITQKREFCTMTHRAKGPDAVELTITRSVTGRTGFGATSPHWSFDNAKEYWIALRGSGPELASGQAYGGSVAGWPSGFSMTLYGEDALPRLLAAHTVTADFSPDHGPLTFAMPPSAMAERDLNACLNDIRAHRDGSGAPAVKPPQLLGTQENLMTADDYPPAAIRSQTGGTVTVRVTVTAIGYPSACTVIASSGSAVLDRTTCGIYHRRARFDPALDAKGRPTVGTYDFTKQWIAPPMPEAQYLLNRQR